MIYYRDFSLIFFLAQSSEQNGTVAFNQIPANLITVSSASNVLCAHCKLANVSRHTNQNGNNIVPDKHQHVSVLIINMLATGCYELAQSVAVPEHIESVGPARVHEHLGS